VSDTHEHCGCGCNCGDAHDHSPMVIKVIMDNDEEIECAVLGVFEANEQEYIALAPTDDDCGDVIFYCFTEDGDTANLDVIETDDEYEAVREVFFEIYDEDLSDMLELTSEEELEELSAELDNALDELEALENATDETPRP